MDLNGDGLRTGLVDGNDLRLNYETPASQSVLFSVDCYTDGRRTYGLSVTGAEQTCSSNNACAALRCDAGDVYCFDECNRRGALHVECGTRTCLGAECREPCSVSISCASTRCHDGDVWCFDNCGHADHEDENCQGSGCSAGACRAGSGCEDGSVEQVYGSSMVGCNGDGAVSQAEAATLCGMGWHLCGLDEYVAKGGVDMPSENDCGFGWQRWLSGTGYRVGYSCACGDGSGDVVQYIVRDSSEPNVGLITVGRCPEDLMFGGCYSYHELISSPDAVDCRCAGAARGALYVETQAVSAARCGAMCCR